MYVHYEALIVCCPLRKSPRELESKRQKVKVGFLYSATYTVEPEQRASQSQEVTVDWQEPVVLRRYAAYPLPALTDIGPAAAASKHITSVLGHFVVISILSFGLY